MQRMGTAAASMGGSSSSDNKGVTGLGPWLMQQITRQEVTGQQKLVQQLEEGS
jgi:hypothetical protein